LLGFHRTSAAWLVISLTADAVSATSRAISAVAALFLHRGGNGTGNGVDLPTIRAIRAVTAAPVAPRTSEGLPWRPGSPPRPYAPVAERPYKPTLTMVFG